MQPLANWRFGSVFRNSIPPERPYKPPTFEDIFEMEHKREEIESTTMSPHKLSLQLNPLQRFGMQSNQEQNMFKYTNKFSEMDRNSESESTKDEYFSRLNQLKEKHQQMLFQDKYETSTKPF